MTDPSVFWSPSDQDNNKGLLDKHEQFYAQQRALAGSRVLLAHKVPVRVSQYGTGDDVNGWAASVQEGDDYGADIYLADHTNAGNGRSRGVHMYVWRDPATGKLDPRAVRLAGCIIARVRPVYGDVPYQILDGSHLGEVNGPTATAVLMEMGFHDQPDDARIIMDRSPEIGAATAYGVLDFYGITTNQEEEMQPIKFVGRDGIEREAPAEQVLGWIIGNQHSIMDRLDQLEAAGITDATVDKIAAKVGKQRLEVKVV